MFWTLELASHLEDAPWPATKDELIDYSIRSGAPIEVIENLQELEDEGDLYEGLDDIWPDYPSLAMIFFIFFSTILWLIYGFGRGALPVIICNGIIFVLSIILLYF